MSSYRIVEMHGEGEDLAYISLSKLLEDSAVYSLGILDPPEGEHPE